jgi:hydroxymethylbilane synthase
MPLSTEIQSINVLARRSPLSQVQVLEIERELHAFYPVLCLKPIFVDTPGDRDRSTSLRDMEKTDFFTRDIDQRLLQGEADVAVHSAKDLPDPLAEGLEIIALTKGVDSSDALVLRAGVSLSTLPCGSKIGSSSERREEMVQAMCPSTELEFVDIRGNIGERLALLDRGEVDGVVIAEAALIRLGLTQRNRVRLEGKTPAGQGQLAVVARSENRVMKELFAPLDSRG